MTQDIRKYALSLPLSTEVEHWGKASFRVNKKIYAVLQNDGVTLTVKTTKEERMMYTSMDPDTFSIPESFSNLNYMHVNLKCVDFNELKGLLFKAWTTVAPKKLVKQYIEKQHQ